MLFILGMYRLIKASQSEYDWQLLLILAGAVFILPFVFGQTNLWLTGSINYLWRDTFMVWVFVPFSDIVIRKKNFAGSWKWFFIAVASLYIGNSTENASTSAILFMLLCILWQILQKRKIYAWMLIATGFTILGWLLLVLSPGTRRDMSTSSASLYQIVQHFGVALNMWREHGLWLSIVYLTVFFFAKKNPNVFKDQLAFSVGLFICSIVSNFIMTAAYYYPDRAIINTTNLLIIAIIMALYSSSTAYRDTIVNILTSVLALTMVLEMTSAVPNAYNRFRQAQARVNEVCIARDSGVCDITTYGIKGLSKYDAFFGLNELTNNPDYAPNVFFSKYYSLVSVVVDRYE